MDYAEYLALEKKLAKRCGLSIDAMNIVPEPVQEDLTQYIEIRPEDGKPKGSAFDNDDARRLALRRYQREAYQRLIADPTKKEKLRAFNRGYQYSRWQNMDEEEKQEFRETQCAYRKHRYATDKEYRRIMIERAKAYFRENKEKINARKRERWATEPEFRERLTNERRAIRRRTRLKLIMALKFKYIVRSDFELCKSFDTDAQAMTFEEWRDMMYKLQKEKRGNECS